MSSLIHPAIGSADEEVFDRGSLARFKESQRLRIDQIPSGGRVFTRTQTGSIYRIEIVDPERREVAVRIIQPRNSKYFGTVQRCLLRGAAFNVYPSSPRAPGWVVQGLPMEFWEVESAESEAVITSPVERFMME